MSEVMFNEVYNTLRGEVTITAHYSSGESKILVEDKNLIVSNGRRMLAQSLIGAAPAFVNDVSFGSGGTYAGNSSAVIPVDPSETAVRLPIAGLLKGSDYILSISNESISAITPRIAFNILIPTASAGLNGKIINELALIFNDSSTTAFAMKRFADISKSDSISISINWVIYF